MVGTLLGSEALSQARLPMYNGGLSLISSSDIMGGGVYVGCQALVLGRKMAKSAGEEFVRAPSGTIGPIYDGRPDGGAQAVRKASEEYPAKK